MAVATSIRDRLIECFNDTNQQYAVSLMFFKSLEPWSETNILYERWVFIGKNDAKHPCKSKYDESVYWKSQELRLLTWRTLWVRMRSWSWIWWPWTSCRLLSWFNGNAWDSRVGLRHPLPLWKFQAAYYWRVRKINWDTKFWLLKENTLGNIALRCNIPDLILWRGTQGA